MEKKWLNLILFLIGLIIVKILTQIKISATLLLVFYLLAIILIGYSIFSYVIHTWKDFNNINLFEKVILIILSIAVLLFIIGFIWWGAVTDWKWYIE